MTVERASGGGAGDFAAADATSRNYCVVRKKEGKETPRAVSIRIVFAIEGVCKKCHSMMVNWVSFLLTLWTCSMKQMVLDWLPLFSTDIPFLSKAPQSR